MKRLKALPVILLLCALAGAQTPLRSVAVLRADSLADLQAAEAAGQAQHDAVIIITEAGNDSQYYWNENLNAWTRMASGIPSGTVVLRTAGTCGAGYTELNLDGLLPLATRAGNADVGTTGGSSSYTPQGTISGISVADHGSHAHTYSEVVNHTHAVNVSDPGHAHVQGVNSATTGGLSGVTPDTSTNTRVNSGYSTSISTTGITASTSNPAAGVSTGTTSGPGATLSHGVTQGTFAGQAATIQPPFVKMLFCRKD